MAVLIASMASHSNRKASFSLLKCQTIFATFHLNVLCTSLLRINVASVEMSPCSNVMLGNSIWRDRPA